MRCGIVTFFSYCNYGAVLQSYALSKTLEKLGHQAEFIDYRNKLIYHPFGLESLKARGPVGYVYATMGNLFYRPRRKSFAAFREQLAHTEAIEGTSPTQYANTYDKYIAGSDQIWNVGHTQFDSTYFLDFVKDPHKKLSYAASFGGSSLDDASREFVAKQLEDFEAIAVREDYAADLVHDLTGRDVAVTVDPTLLLNDEEWNQVATPKKAGKPFILVYQLGFSGKLVQYVNELSKRTGLKVEYVPFPLGGVAAAHLNLGLSPADWLARFRDAEYIITDSFHGVVFSVLFRKKFLVVADGQHKNQRAVNLLTKLGIEERVSTPENPCDIADDIDYETVEQRLVALRKASVDWLDENVR